MEISPELDTALNRLNPEQRAAVECLDGPLLVIAGPGTGKTQLLSLRAANILAKRDAAPRNILCLTYTEAGAEAMRKRLIELIGRDAYGIEVSTFHGFAASARSRYPECFTRPATDALITPLHQKEILDRLLKHLPPNAPLSAVVPDGPAVNIGKMVGFVSKVKRSGMDYSTLGAIAQQNIDAAAWLAENSTLLDLVCGRASAGLAERFENEVEHVCTMAPRTLTQPVPCPAGSYVPFIVQLRDTVRRTELIDERGKSSGYTKVRDQFFGGSNKEGRTFKVAEVSERLKCACAIAQDYQAELDRKHLYDYDDMIRDFVRAVESDASLRQALQDTYTYIQVDEFQDTNGAQMRIIELLCDGLATPNVMCVGDDDQAIMRFQGATIECANQFAAEFKPQSIVLKTNYRSTPAIVELGQEVARQIEHRLGASADKAIVAHRPDGDQVEFAETVYPESAVEYAAVAASIKARLDAGYLDTCEDPNEGIAVIASKHAALRALIPYLVKENVPFSYRERQNLFASERMQTTLALLRCVTALARGRRELAESYLPQIICAEELGGDHRSSVAFALYAKREHHGSWLDAMRESDNACIHELYECLIRWTAEAHAAPVRALLFDIGQRGLAFYRVRSKSDPLAAAEFNAGMRAMLAFVEGELGDARVMGRALRLPDIVDRLDAAQKFNVSIDAAIDLGTPGAVRLTTAHSSKGLEFDCVYLLDADDSTWHKGAGGASLYPSNLLMQDEKDADDARRLLFVAITRAKRHLELHRAGGSMLQELTGLIDSREANVGASALDAAIKTDWRDCFAFDTPELQALLDPHHDAKHLSTTALNTFVTYEPGCTNSLHFPEKQIVRLPTAPTIATEFGTIVHAMFKEIADCAPDMRAAAVKEIEQAHRQQISWLDFAPEDVERYLWRFDRICQTFVPWLLEHLTGYRCATETMVECATPGGTPLFGFLDLMLIDDDAKTVQIIDYKTGYADKISPGYVRQLKFYKMMVECSPEFAGYTVTSMGDYYVEPDRKTGELRPPFMTSATPEDTAVLEQLTDAVWSRIVHGSWDTSAFEQSDAFDAAREEQKGQRKKDEKAAIMQQAYERWLVENPAESATAAEARKEPGMISAAEAFMDDYADVFKELAE